MKKFFTLIAVAMLAFAAQANVLTLCDGGYYSGSVPIYGLWADTENTIGQMIYPADMLADMVGCEISEVKFYTTAYYYENYDDIANAGTNDYINFEGATIQLSLKVVDETSLSTAIEGATAVATTEPEKGDAGMTFTLDEPFVYEGGNLLVECKVIVAGDYGTTYFYGAGLDEGTNCCYFGYQGYSGWNEDTFDFLPMITFTYGEDVSEPAYYVVGFNDWENPIEITEEGATIDVQQQDFNNPDDTAQEFKIITTDADGETVWLGGVDNNNVGYFMIEDSMLDSPISLDNAGANFRLPEPGNYTIHLAFLEKSTVSGLIMFVTKNQVTGVNGIADKTVAGVKYYNLTGIESSRPFNGINVVVTTYTDGTTSTTKVVK